MDKNKNLFPYFLLVAGVVTTFYAFLYSSGYRFPFLKKNQDVADPESEPQGEVKAEGVSVTPTETVTVKQNEINRTPAFTASLTKEIDYKGSNAWIINAKVSANENIANCNFELGYPGMITYKDGTVSGNTCSAESDKLSFGNLRAWVRVTSVTGKVAETGQHPWQ